MKYGLTETTVENICAVFARFPAIERAILYGSRAKGNFKTGSDIDLTLCGGALTSDLCSTVASALDDLMLPYTIDLSVFDGLNHEELREHIERVGVVFYERAKHGTAMKESWQRMTIGDVCDVVNGGTPKTGVSAYWDGPHQWITPAEMGKRSSPYIDRTERTITDEGLQNSSARLLPPHSVILSSRAPIGHLVINTEPMATNQGCKGLIPGGRIDSKFLFYYLTSIVALLNDLGTGATFKELSGSKMKEVVVPVPALPEQHRIVGILDEAFEGIATAKANAEKNLQNARALFESHLQSVFTQRGEGWVEKPLDTVAAILNGYAFKSTDFSPQGGLKCIKITNVGVREFVCESDGYLPNDFTAKYDAVSVTKGSIVLALTRTIIALGLKVAVVPDEYDGALLNQRVASIITNHKFLTGPFLFAYMSTQTVFDYVKQRVNTLMQPNLSIADLRRMPIPVPPLCEQGLITDQLSGLHVETQRLESIYQKKIAALEALKKSLLHQAFSGHL